MTDGVDPGVNEMKPTGPEPAFNRVLPQPERLQLPPRHNSTLPLGKLGDQLIIPTSLL